MNMYTILLVEDEEAVRHSIRDLTPWDEYGFSVMGEASNGMEALEIISETMPDVIITDIRMPYMDGIQFIKEVRDKYSQSVMVIFLSGYDEFTFAQTALSLNAAEYVLKPVSIDSMRALLERTHKKLDEDVARVSDRTKLEAFYHDAFEIYKEKFLVSLITPTRKKDELLIAEKASEYGVPLKGSIFAVSVIDLPQETLSSVAMEEIIDESAADSRNMLSFQYENQIVLIFSSEMGRDFSPLFIKQIYRSLSLLQSRLIHYFSHPFSIGIGEVVFQTGSLPASYKSAMEALNYTHIYPEQHIISISDVESVGKTFDEKTRNDLKTDLVMALKFGTAEETEDRIHAFFTGLAETADIQNAVLSIIAIIAEICTSYGRNIALLLDGDDLFLELSHANTSARAEELARKLGVSANKMASGVRENSHIQFVENAKRIIKERYSESAFGLEQVAEEISVSPAYFSTTFKKETGLSFVQYLTNIRLEKAKELLKNTDKKTYEIAEAIGFSEPNYFSFTFKKNIGLSPSQYRAGNRQ